MVYDDLLTSDPTHNDGVEMTQEMFGHLRWLNIICLVCTGLFNTLLMHAILTKILETILCEFEKLL